MITIDKTKTISDKEMKKHREELHNKLNIELSDLTIKERDKKAQKEKDEIWR